MLKNTSNVDGIENKIPSTTSFNKSQYDTDKENLENKIKSVNST